MANNTDLDRRFSILRSQLEQKARVGSQEQEEALKRRFAAMGQLSSGAAIKTLGNVKGEQAKRLEEAGQTAEMAKMQEQQRIKEIEDARRFQTSEREAGQKFASGESALGRKFASGEREAGQKFAAAQAELQRKYATGEREASQKYATAERLAQQGFSAKMVADERAFQDAWKTEEVKWQMTQWAEQMGMARQQFDLDKRISEFNMGMAQADYNKPGLTDIITNPLGFGQYQAKQVGAAWNKFRSGGAKSFF